MNKEKKGIKYTLYQAAKFSKISRYKLEQAISDGLLAVSSGKNNIKCFIYKGDLEKFIEDHGDQFIKHKFDDENKYYDGNFIPKEIHEKMLSEKERLIQLLERQNERILPLIQQQSSNNLAVSNEISQAVSNEIKDLISSYLKQETARQS
jgi:hypothetical protein